MEKSKQFSLLIKPASADCNLHCKYCFYLGHQHFYSETPKHRMPFEVLEKMISSYMATQQQQYLFGWQGGEPLLMGYDFYKAVIEFQKKYGKNRLVVSNGLQTNGTLIDDKIASLFAEYKFLVGISLDGSSEYHDVYRTNLSGEGTHKKVAGGIELLKKHGVEFNILCLVSKANVNNAKEVFRYYIDHDYNYLQFIPCVEFDENDILAPFAITGEEWGNFLCSLFDEWMHYGSEKVYIRGFEAILAKLIDNSVFQCTMGSNCCTYFVSEWNGDVYPCDFFVRRELKLGNIMHNSWNDMDRTLIYQNFGKQKSQRSKPCKICPYLKLCAGDCLKHRLYGTSSRPEQRSHLCEGWKIFFKHSLPRFKKLAEKIRSRRR